MLREQGSFSAEGTGGHFGQRGQVTVVLLLAGESAHNCVLAGCVFASAMYRVLVSQCIWGTAFAGRCTACNQTTCM